MKPQPPETLRQAKTWESVKNKALKFGLCPRCASQLAWGHQGGFTTVHPPCAECAPLVATLPKARANGWRTVVGDAAGKWPESLTPSGDGSGTGSVGVNG